MPNKNRMHYVRKLAAKFKLSNDRAGQVLDDATMILEQDEEEFTFVDSYELAVNHLNQVAG